MDTFDVTTLEAYIKKYKSNIVNKLDTLILNDKTITNQCDDVCMVLEYSPKINKRSNYFPKYQIQNEKRHSEKRMPLRNQSLNLESRLDANEEEEEEEEENEEEEKKEEEIDKDLGKLSRDNNKPESNIIDKTLDNDKSPLESQDANQQNEENHQGSQAKDRYTYDMTNDRYIMNIQIKQKRLLLEGKIRVYVLNTEKFLEFEIIQEETFKQLKKKVLDKLESAANFSLEQHNIDSYEFRIVNEYNIVQFNEPPIDESESIMTKGEDVIAFLQKQQFVGFGRLSTQPKPIKLIGNVISSSEVDKINLKIFIKLDVNNPSSTILQLATESTLKNVIELLADKSKIPYKNPDLYYFIEHSNKNTVNDDAEDAINVNMQLKSLTTFEIDVSNIFS